MTVVADERVPAGEENQQKNEASGGGIFYRICCCCSTSEKEPPVQLIRSGSLTYQQGDLTAAELQHPQISAVNESIDDQDKNKDRAPKPANDQKGKEDNEEEEGFNINDILMDGVIRNAEEDKTETLEEDAISISTDVVQEVDESDLPSVLEVEHKTSNDSNEFVKPLKGRKATITNEDSVSIHSRGDEDNRKMSVIEFIKSEAEMVSKEEQEVPPKPARDPEVTQSEISDSEEEVTNPEFKEATISMSEEEEEEEEDVAAPPPLPLEPPPRLSSALGKSPIPPPRSPRQSKMYQNADDSDSSDDEEEEEEEAIKEGPPVNGLSKMQPVTFAPSPKPIDSSSSSESAISSDEEEKEEEEEQLGVTRISVKSNGQAQIHSPRSPVRVSLDADRQIVTDDEFSEKLI